MNHPWYAATVVNLHIDNHSRIVGRDLTEEELFALFRNLDVDMIQVSAYGNQGTELTYPSERLPGLRHPELEGYDMVGRFAAAVKRAGKRFFIYINTRGLALDREHPGWVQLDENGKGSDFKGGNDMCARPTADGSGYLERILIPLLEELTERYDPDGFWIDGDHARYPACYCPDCRAAWRAGGETGDPPGVPGGDVYRRWMRLELDRRDEGKRLMAAAVHRVKPDALYCSNHGWRNTYTASRRNIDPRSGPEWADYLSADLSHGDSIAQTRLMAMGLSAEEETAHDIMHLTAARIARRKFLQQGALTLASGSPWFLWGGSTFVDNPADQANVRLCVEFARSRQPALGGGSASPIAVLTSETAWVEQWLDGAPLSDVESARSFALGLQDAGFPVDIVNERLLASRIDRYRAVAVTVTGGLGDAARGALDRFRAAGGVVIPIPDGGAPYPDWDGAAAAAAGAAGVGRFIRVSGENAGRHLVFALRSLQGSTVLHITDLTSYRDGARVVPGEGDTLDWDPDLIEMELAIECPENPISVTAHPGSTAVSSRREGDSLVLMLVGFTIHAAVVLEGVDPSTIGMLSGEKPVSSWTAYPAALRNRTDTDPCIEHGHLVQ